MLKGIERKYAVTLCFVFCFFYDNNTFHGQMIDKANIILILLMVINLIVINTFLHIINNTVSILCAFYNLMPPLCVVIIDSNMMVIAFIINIIISLSLQCSYSHRPHFFYSKKIKEKTKQNWLSLLLCYFYLSTCQGLSLMSLHDLVRSAGGHM